MSHNVFVKSSIHNFGSSDYDIINEELSKVKNPKFSWEDGDLVIREDFDRRHIRALQKAINRNWKERKKIMKIPKKCPHCRSTRLKHIVDDGFKCLKCGFVNKRRYEKNV